MVFRAGIERIGRAWGRRHETRLYWEACGWDWSAADSEFEEAGKRHDNQDFDWEPVAVKRVLLAKDPKVPVMTRAQAEENRAQLQVAEAAITAAEMSADGRTDRQPQLAVSPSPLSVQ